MTECDADRSHVFGWKQKVEPELVITKAADGLEIHNQLFVPKDIKPGERRPWKERPYPTPLRKFTDMTT